MRNDQKYIYMCVCVLESRRSLKGAGIQQLSVYAESLLCRFRSNATLSHCSPPANFLICALQPPLYSRSEDFLKVKDVLDVIYVLFPRAVAGLAVFLRHFAPGRRWGGEEGGGEKMRRRRSLEEDHHTRVTQPQKIIKEK